MTDNLTVVILAAGLGTRMVSRKAKVLHEAGGLTLVEHVVNSSTAVTDPGSIIVVTGYQADRVEAVLGARGVQFARQTEQKGTGHALMQCAPLARNRAGRVIVAYGDCPLLRGETLQTLIAHHNSSGLAATMITCELDNPYGYGRVLMDESGNVLAIVEEKVATPEQKAVRLINSGIYCFEAETLWSFLEKITPNPISKEYYLTDIVELLNAAGHRVGSVVHHTADELLGINTRLELSAVDSMLRAVKVKRLMAEGVTVLQPESVMVDVSVVVGMDTVVEPHVQLLGSTRVGEDCRIGTGSILKNCQLANGVDIAPYSILTGSTVATKATIGPFARLRGDDIVEEGAHIGNFVELKKTTLGAGAKAGHFAYLGDAHIGAGANIGAGTIVCNYDGVKKHKSHIGERSFIGSNSTLVAPVQVGNDAYVAAGSVVTEPVPDDALAIGRGKQANKPGWAKRRRERQSAT